MLCHAIKRSTHIVGTCPLFCFIFLTYFLEKLISTSRMFRRALRHQRQLRHSIICSLIQKMFLINGLFEGVSWGKTLFKVGCLMGLTMALRRIGVRSVKRLFGILAAWRHLSQQCYSPFDSIIFTVWVCIPVIILLRGIFTNLFEYLAINFFGWRLVDWHDVDEIKFGFS